MMHLKIDEIELKRNSEIAKRCLIVSLDNSIFQIEEYHTLIGVQKSEVKEIVDNWKVINLKREEKEFILKNVMNNLLGYPHEDDSYVENKLGISLEKLENIYNTLF